MKASLQINESALIRNLKFAFSNSFTVITELLQNSRRAGASKIEITVTKEGEETVLNITDDGQGISDFQKLLTVAESGWNEKTVEEEGAFGMGFLSALFAARRVTVCSNGHTMDMDTEHMLSMQEISIVPVSEYVGSGASVTMYGVDAKAVEKQKLQSLVEGFPIPVSLNGVELARPAQLTSKYVPTNVGHLLIDCEKIASLNPFTVGAYSFDMYLQGFLMPDGMYRNKNTVIHLDPKQYRGRMPDRDKLVDSRAALADCNKALDTVMEAWLKEKYSLMPQEMFFGMYGSFVKSRFPAMLNECVSFVPACVLVRPESISQYSDCMDMNYGRNVSRTDVENGTVLLFDMEHDSYVEEGANDLLWQYILHNEHCYVVDRLPEGHWAKQYLIKDANNDFVQVDVCNPGKKGQVSGNYISSSVQLCEKVVLSHNGDAAVEVLSDCVYSPEHGILAPVSMDGKSKTIPNTATCLHAAVCYCDNEDYAENDFVSDSDSLERVIRNLATQDFAVAITEAIQAEHIQYQDGVQNKRFIVSFDAKKDSASVTTVELSKVLAKLVITEESVQQAVQAVLKEQEEQA